MEGTKRLRGRSAPPRTTLGQQNTQLPATPSQSTQPHKTVIEGKSAKASAPEPLETSKKRKASASEPPETRLQPEAKKPRNQEELATKKSVLQPLKPLKSIQGAKEAPASTVQNKAQEIASKKEKTSKLPSAPGAVVSKSWPNSIGKQKIKGLENPHVWCYRRSVLQSLIALPQLFNLLESFHRPCSNQAKCVSCALRQLIRTYHTSDRKEVGRALNALDTAIKLTGKSSDPRWSAVSATQEDSHDFLQYLLGTIGSAKGIPKDLSASLFRIKHRISWTCRNCKKEHVRSDPPGLSLSLPIPKQGGQVNISACLDTYHVERNVTILCDKCKKNTSRTRVFRIEESPEILCIQLMRFTFNGFGTNKNKQHVEYPEELDMSPWALNGSKPLKYRLKAVVAHSGSLKSGHYIAFVRGADGIQEISDSHFNDSSAKEFRKPSSGFTPYILVYIKQ